MSHIYTKVCPIPLCLFLNGWRDGFILAMEHWTSQTHSSSYSGLIFILFFSLCILKASSCLQDKGLNICRIKKMVRIPVGVSLSAATAGDRFCVS